MFSEPWETFLHWYHILTNCPKSFQDSCPIEIGLSDFHKLVVTVMKQLTKSHNQKKLSIAVVNISVMEVLEKNCYKMKPMEITAMKVKKLCLFMQCYPE